MLFRFLLLNRFLRLLRCRQMSAPGLRLKQPRIQTIVSCLQQIQQRRRLCDIVLIELVAAREHGIQIVDTVMLQPLRVIRADDAETNGRGQRTAAGLKQNQALRCGKRHVQRGQRRAAHGPEVSARRAGAVLEFDQRVARPNPGAGAQKRAALDTARAVGHGVRQKCLRTRVEGFQPVG